MALAKCTGADVACLQGTLFDGVGEWTKHGYHFFSLNRSGPRQKDGCMIAVSTTFPSHADQMRTPHLMLGRIVGLRLKCGEARNAGDVYLISAHAPVHDERTQISTSEALRIEFWRTVDGGRSSSPAQVPRDSVHGCQWRKWTQHLFGLEVQAARTRDRREQWTPK